MIVGYLDIMRIALTPAKTDAPLILDANAVLARSIPRQLLQSIAGWGPEIVEGVINVKRYHLAGDSAVNGRVSRNSTAVPGPTSPASSSAFQFVSRTQPEELA